MAQRNRATLKATLETQEGHSRGWALSYGRGFDKEKEALEKLKKALNFYQKIESTVPEEERWKMMRQASDTAAQFGAQGLTPSEYKMPSEIVNEAIKSVKKTMEFENQASVSQQQQAEDSKESQGHIMSARKYALRESYNSYAEAGLHAFDQTRGKKLPKPLIITMENIFPESYGSHPDELKSLIQNSRKKMAEKLVSQRGISEAEAQRILTI